MKFINVKGTLEHFKYSTLVKPLEKLEISLTPELMKKIDDDAELLDYGSREELVICVIRRFLDKYQSPYIRSLIEIPSSARAYLF